MGQKLIDQIKGIVQISFITVSMILLMFNNIEKYKHTINNSFINKLGYLPLGDHGVVDIKSTILPLYGTVNVQSIAQPVI